MDLTLPQLEALEERRAIDIRYGRFNAALIASVLVNSHLTSDADPVSPFDFLPGFARDEAEIEREKLRKSTKKAVALAFMQMKGASADEVAAERKAMVRRMTENGVEDADELIREVFPEL